jgi:RimJ/RimL family protein N-acetyltransferase
VARYQDWEAQPDHEARRFIEKMSQVDLFSRGTWCQLAIALRSTNAIVGDVGVCVSADGRRAELGFTLASEAQGGGLGTEAVRALIALIFDQTDVTEVVAVTDSRNTPALRLAERVGMQNTETVHTRFRGEPCIEYVWSMVRASARNQSMSDRTER